MGNCKVATSRSLGFAHPFFVCVYLYSNLLPTTNDDDDGEHDHEYDKHDKHDQQNRCEIFLYIHLP